MKYAILIGIAPIVLAFLAGFFGFIIHWGWSAYIAWFVVSLAVGAAVVAVKNKQG